MAGWALVAWHTGALPRWLAIVGAVSSVGHVFNSQVLMSHLRNELTLVPTLFFLVWFLSAGIYLAGGGRTAGAVLTRGGSWPPRPGDR
ncbi:MAG: hypothetical protein ABI838_06500, partial [Chloroflexota bacterium]